MTELDAISLGREFFYHAVLLTMPALVVSLVIGFIISIFSGCHEHSGTDPQLCPPNSRAGRAIRRHDALADADVDLLHGSDVFTSGAGRSLGLIQVERLKGTSSKNGMAMTTIEDTSYGAR